MHGEASCRHAKEPPADHVATNLGVRGAVQQYGRRVSVFEYPVWYWCQGPCLRLHDDALGLNRTALRQTVRTLAGLRGVRMFNSNAYVGDVVDVKRRWQRSGRRWSGRRDKKTGLSWRTLGGGDFLKRLLR